ncbi:hypothetical protein GLYMA_07G209666v4 [Glycine max]|nr:hypothetical protein GLYMA_07G209666v4 [Glycine max]KAH1087859.1 hypothetical protein GYH30_019095 [Glycine max]
MHEREREKLFYFFLLKLLLRKITLASLQFDFSLQGPFYSSIVSGSVRPNKVFSIDF